MLPIHVPGGSWGAAAIACCVAIGDGVGDCVGIGETITGAAGPTGPGATLGSGAVGTATTPGGSVRWEPGVGVAGIATTPGGSAGLSPGAAKGVLGTAGGGAGGADRTVVATKVAIVRRIRFVFIFLPIMS